jgi:hypothetical protein
VVEVGAGNAARNSADFTIFLSLDKNHRMPRNLTIHIAVKQNLDSSRKITVAEGIIVIVIEDGKATLIATLIATPMLCL